jgi:hypothetical protein
VTRWRAGNSDGLQAGSGQRRRLGRRRCSIRSIRSAATVRTVEALDSLNPVGGARFSRSGRSRPRPLRRMGVAAVATLVRSCPPTRRSWWSRRGTRRWRGRRGAGKLRRRHGPRMTAREHHPVAQGKARPVVAESVTLPLRTPPPSIDFGCSTDDGTKRSRTRGSVAMLTCLSSAASCLLPWSKPPRRGHLLP